MTADIWAELVNNYYMPPASLRFNGKQLVEAIRRTRWLNELIESTEAVNEDTCLYRNKHRPKGGSLIYCFYAAPKGQKPTGENATSNWFLNLSTELLNVKITRSSSLTLNLPMEQVETTEVLGKRKRPQTKNTSSPSIKKVPDLERNSTGLLPSSSASIPEPSLSATPHPSQVDGLATPLPSLVDDFGNYWLSPEAKKLFAPKENETMLEGIDNQLSILKKVNETHMSYLDIIDVQQDEMLDEDSLTSYQVWALQQHCVVLCLALKIAKEKMNGITWQQCCKEAIEYSAAMGTCFTSKA
jgi:hypothetical protein